jgi:hypothetical protein
MRAAQRRAIPQITRRLQRSLGGCVEQHPGSFPTREHGIARSMRTYDAVWIPAFAGLCHLELRQCIAGEGYIYFDHF